MIPIWGTSAVLTAPLSALLASGYVPGNTLAAQNMNWLLNHITKEMNNVLTAASVVQNTAVDNQLLTSILNLIGPANYLAVSAGSPYSLVAGSYGTLDVQTGAGFQVVLPSAQTALAIGFEVDLRKSDAGSAQMAGSGSMLITLTNSADYLAGFLNGQWQITEQWGHLRIRPVRVGAAYGWIVQSCDGTMYRNVITTSQTAVLSSSTWTNKGGSLTLSPGIYELMWQAVLGDNTAQATMGATLSTANNSETDIDFTSSITIVGASSDCGQTRRKRVFVSATTTYYLNVWTASTAQTAGFYAGAAVGNIVIEAKRVG